MKLAQVIKKIQFESEFNQSEIADILECTQTTISRLKRGSQIPKAPLLLGIIKLAKKYNIDVTIEDLLSSRN
jgi:transcriptional regulator with XRE-family HTH domain